MYYSDHNGYTVTLSIKNGEIYLHAMLEGLSIRIIASVKKSHKQVFFERKQGQFTLS